jgi:Uma2 family endonuclease
MATAPKTRYTPEEYLALEATAEHRSEYYQGEIFAMAGGTPRHNDITLNLVASLRGKLKGGPCKAHAMDLRVQVSKTGLYTYPDVVVYCGETALQQNTLLNPRVIVEVLSPGTEKYDRGLKFQQYRQLPSLAEYILVSQETPHIERFVREENGTWRMTEAKGLDRTIELIALGCTLAFSEVYDGVAFEPESPSATETRIIQPGPPS